MSLWGDKPVAPHAVRLNDLVAAIRQAQYAVRRTGTPADPGMVAFDNFAHELIAALVHPERNGAGVLPDAAPRPPVEPVPPAPLLRFIVTCSCEQVDVSESLAFPQTVPGLRDDFCDVHGYRDRGDADAGLCAWRHPLWRDIRCTMVATQRHVDHEQHNVFGSVVWNSRLAATGPGVPAFVLDWPTWTGKAS